MRLLLVVKKLRSAAAVATATSLLSIGAAWLPVHVAQAASPDQKTASQKVPASPSVHPPAKAGASSYAEHCAICHGDNREGILPGFPPLGSVKRQMSDQQITALIRDGKGRMPPFPTLPKDEVAALLRFLGTKPAVETELPAERSSLVTRKGIQLSPEAAAGGALFQQNCAFCHGRDAMGGETGPDLTRSKLVLADSNGSAIAQVVSEGRTNNDKKMPAFRFSSSEVTGLVAFIRARITAAEAMKGGRRGVEVSDLQTGNAQAGKEYFNGAGGCAKCHSPTGDLAGVATRNEGLQLEERMLYPHNAKSTVTVTLPDGRIVTGTLAYRDEFTIALTDHDGTYKSWPVQSIQYKVDSPVNAHVELFSRYTDDDIHNLMAYIQTLR
jgi:mono/diheme cytochrome c family protein